MSLVVRLYQIFISPLTHLVGLSFFGPSFACRFRPTCSAYSRQALAKYGIIRGGLLSLKRFLRCHPWSGAPINNPVL